MKNKIYKSVLAAMIVFTTVMPAFALNLTPEIKTIATKFVIAMAGVFAFSSLLYIGLSLYNRFFVNENIKDFNLRRDSLRTPTDKDEAVMMFIAKNRLR